MAKRIRRLNPEEARTLGRDIEDVVHGSGSTIDAAYDEHKQVQRDLNIYEDTKDNLKANGQSVPKELRVAIAEYKIRLRELDRRIVRHGKVMLKRVKERMDIVRVSPGAAFNRQQIKDVDKAVFRLERKMKNKGTDIRPDLSRIMGMLVTLEQDSGIVIRRAGKKLDEKSRRKAEESELFGKLVEQWKRVYKHAKKDPRVKEDVEWVTAQIRSLDVRFRRGESIRRGVERVSKRVFDIHNRTKPRKTLKSYSSAKKGVADFVSVVQEYSQGEVTAAGIDRLKYELEQFTRQFTPKAKSEWSAEDRRQFGRDIRNIRKALDHLKPKGRRKKNPCVGLHFHGKDAGDLLKALEESADRQSKPKKNPKKATRKKATPSATLIKKCQKLWDVYCDKPTKKNLRAVLEHLEKMKESKAKTVKSERSRCLRIANKEAKRLKVK